MDEFYNIYQPSRSNEPRDDEYWVRIEVFDGHATFLGEVGDFIDCNFAFSSAADDVEASTLTIPGSSPWSRIFMRANLSVILVHSALYRGKKKVKQWTGRVERSVRKRDNRQSTVSVDLVSDKIWFKYIVGYSAPFSSLAVQIPKTNTKFGTAIHEMKKFAIDNLLRYQPSSLNGVQKVWESNYQLRPERYSEIHTFMNPIMVVPTDPKKDTSPMVVLQSRMDTLAEIWTEVANDYNLLPTITFHVPGRDTLPAGVTMPRKGLLIDIVDKDITRARGQREDFFKAITKEIGVFIRGLFGRFDAPVSVDTYNPTSLRYFFGDRPDDPWVIFRDSDEHWVQLETSSYSPMSTTSIAGGKAHDALNKGLELVVNTAIKLALASIGIVFGNLLSGELDDILFAYQKAEDKDMRRMLGPYALNEDFEAAGTTAYSFDAVQKLRMSRFTNMGYRTAGFSGTLGQFPPFRPFEDFDLLDPVGWEDNDEGRILTERVKSISYSKDRSGVQFEVRVGEDGRPEEPWGVQVRRNTMFKQGIKAALLLD